MQTSLVRNAVLSGVLLACALPGGARAALDQSCVVSILNRTVQVSPQGGWSMPNVPSNMGRVRARATCIQNGQTVSGESDYFAVTTNGIVTVGEIRFGGLDPIPVSLAFSQQGMTTLGAIGATYQIRLMATYADGSVKDVTSAASGANYISTNPAVASVSPGGLVTAVSSGTVLITARKDEVVAIKEVAVQIGGDLDGDGLPDDYELANGLNPNDAIDAQEDHDNDGLTALREFQLGTNPRNSDTDGDGLSDGDEVAGTSGFITNPLTADTDGDGLADRIELLAGSSPINANDRNFAAALDRITATPGALVLTFNTINSEASAQLRVTGVLIDGSTIDLTRKTSGTTYASGNLAVASFSATDGEIFAGQAGSTTLTIANSGKQVQVPVTVESFQPVVLSAIDIPGYANNVDVAGDYAFVAAGAAGLQVVNVSDRTAPAIVASLDTDGTAIDIRVFGNYAYLADGEAGLKIIDISNPESPQLVASLDTAGIAQDVKVDKQLAYIADGARGLVIVDVSNPLSPVLKSELGSLGEAQGVDVEGTRAVVVAGSSLFVLDVSSPVAPVVIGTLGIGDVKDVVMSGNHAYLAVYGAGYRVVNIANPASPVIVGGDARIAPRDVELTDDFAFFAEQLFPNVVAYVNVQDPANPLFQGVIDLSRFGDYAGTGIAVDGSYAYVTEESYVVTQDYKATGVTRLFIAQYRLINDRAGIPPTVAITRPAADAVVVEGTTVTVEVNARDDVGVRAVAFAIDGQTVFTDTTQPYQVPVAVPLGRAGIRLTATAVDFGNNIATAELNLRVLADTDRDGLGDEQEVLIYGTDMTRPDSDFDGLLDGFEVAIGTNPLAIDTDGDGKPDKLEVDDDTDPLNPDATPPTITATAPLADDTGVPENQPVTISFSEKLRPNSVKTDSIKLTKNGAVAAGGVQLLGNGTQLVFTPTGLLDDFSAYVVTVAGVRDLAGNPLAAPLVFTYTTGNVVDTTAPKVFASNPANGDTDVPVNASVLVILDEPVDPRTVTDSSFYVYDSVGAVAGTGALAEDGRTLAFVPNAALSVKRTHYVQLQGVKDLFGNALYTSLYFTTGFSADAAAPKIIGTSIQDGQTAVPTNAIMSVRFDEPVNALSLANFRLSTGGEALPITREFNADHTLVTLKYGQPLQADTVYVITVNDVADLSGNVLAVPRTVNFTTGPGIDTAGPVLVLHTPANAATGVPLNTLIERQYNERLNPATVVDTAVKLYDGTTGQFLAGTISLSADGTTVRFVPAAALTANRLYYFYTAYNTYVQDLAGNNAGSTSAYFTTGDAARNSAPAVLLSSLADGTIGVPVNGRLVVQFDAALADRCVSAQTVRVSAGGVAVAGALALSTDRRQLTFTPGAALSVDTTYTVTLDGLCDLAGNVLGGVATSFTTAASATADTTAPTVVISPANAATNIPASSAVTFTFNEAVDITTLASALQVAVNGLSGEVAGQLAVNGNVVTFTPTQPFPGNTRINVSVSSVRDLAGNARSASSYFTTGAATDVVAPQLLSITPNDKAVDIGTGTPIVLTFSESLNPTTVNNNNFVLFVNGAVLRPSVSRSDDNRTVILTASLPASSVVAVIVTADVKDLSGNALADFASVFTMALANDLTRPSVVRQFPGSGASGVLTDASIVLYTSEVMNGATLPGALHVAQNGQLVAGTVTLGASGQTIVFQPLQPWAFNALIEVYLDSSALDSNGNALNNYQGQFRTVADPLATAPAVVSYSAASGLPTNAVMDLGFNQVLNPATVTDARVVLRASNGQVIASTLSLLKANRVIRLTPQAPLPVNTYVYVQFTAGITDTEGQALGNPCCYYFYTAADAVADNVVPKVLALNPPDGATNIGINGYVHARFDEAMNPLSLWPEQAQTGYESLVWSSDDRSVEFLRHDPYPVNSLVSESVAGVEDYAGNAVAAPNSTSFTTGTGPDFTAPVITDSTPFNGATGVPVNALIRLRFSEPLDPAAVNVDSAYLYDTQLGTVAATATLEPDGRAITYVPAEALAVNRAYYVYAYYVRDLAGNLAYLTRYFTTGLVADAQAPVVTGTSLTDAMTGVPINAVISVVFDEPVNEHTLAGITLSRNGTVVATEQVLSADHRTVTLRLRQLLQQQAAYVFAITGVADLSGNVLAVPRTVNFTTGPGIDTAGPVLVLHTPANAATGVPLNTLIERQYNERLNPATVVDTAVKLYDGTTGQFLAGTISLSADGTTVRFVPAAALTANRLYYFYTAYNTYVQDLAGNNAGSTSAYFTTGDAARNSAPAVLLSSLADGTIGVPVNGRLVVQFDAALADRCVSAQTVRVSAGGVAVAGALALSTDRRQLTFTPGAALSVDTTYTVTLDGLCDLAGNVLGGVATSFTTAASATADTTAPTVVISPANAATNIPASSAVTFTFNEAVDITTLASALQVAVNGLSGEVAGQLAVNGNVVTFTPTQPFPGNTRINVSVSSVRDLAGNARSASSYFTTGAATDVVAPQLLSITPNDKAVDIGTGTPIVLTFSESLNPTTVNNNNFVLFVNGAVLRPSVSRSDDNRTVILTASLPASSVVAVIVTADVKDLSGNALADFASVFTMALANDLTRPSVVRQFPGSGASGVLTDASIVLYTSEVMNGATLPGALHVAQNGQLVAGTVTLGASGQTIVFQPLQPWAFNALIEVYLDSSALDSNGNALNNYQGQFRTVADPLATAPAVVSYSAASGLPTNAVMDLGFNQVLNPATVTDARVVLRASNGQVIASTLSLLKANRVIRLTPQAPLPVNTYVYVQFTAGITDTEGQALGNPCCYYFYTAADAVADNVVPKVLALNPPDGATNIGINGYVHARFDEAMNPLSLWPEQAQTGYESLVWSSDDRSVEFLRHDPYPVNSLVSESVAGVEDYAGNAVAAPNSTSFTTGTGPDFTAPVITDSTPFNGATGVPVNALIRLRFSEPLDPAAVNVDSAYLYDTQLGTVAATATLEPDGRAITYVPAEALAVNRAYYVYAYYVRDLAGNLAYLTRYFTTGLVADAQAPVVTGTSLTDAMTGVPINAVISVVFDEPVNEHTLAGITLSRNGTVVATEQVLSGDHRTVTLRLRQLLQQQAAYVFAITGVADLSGNVLAVPRTVNFTTGPGIDTAGPVLVLHTPANAATGVPLNTLIERQYNERLNPATVVDTAVRLYDGTTGQFLAGTISLSADGTTVRFVPAAALTANRLYYFYTAYNTYVQDLAGNNAGSTSAYFTTGAQ